MTEVVLQDTVQNEEILRIDIPDGMLLRISDNLFFDQGLHRGILALNNRKAADCLDELGTAVQRLGGTDRSEWTGQTPQNKEYLDSFHEAAEVLSMVLHDAAVHPESVFRVLPLE